MAKTNIYNQISSESKTRKFSQDYYDVLKTFTNIAEKYPLLNKEKERCLIENYRNDRQSLNKLLFYHNIRIVLNLSRKYLKTVENPADLLMNGAHGLMIAAERFDIDKGTKFNTYATKWVFKYLLMCFYSKSPITGVNQTSLNLPFFNGSEDYCEKIDYLNDFEMNDETSSFSGSGSTFLNSIDFTKINKQTVQSPRRDCEISSNATLVNDVINVISANPQFNEIDKDIIYNNMMENNFSINALAQKYHIPSKEINKRKRKLISDFRSMLSTKYNINSMRDII